MTKTVTTARIHLRSVVLAGLLLTPVIAASATAERAGTPGEYRHLLAPDVYIGELLLKRQGSRSVRLQFTLSNESDSPVSLSKLGVLSEHHDMRDLSLVDFEAGIRYAVVADSNGDYLGSHGPDVVPPGAEQLYWAQFTAPPASTRRLTISFGNALPIDDVPLQP